MIFLFIIYGLNFIKIFNFQRMIVLCRTSTTVVKQYYQNLMLIQCILQKKKSLIYSYEKLCEYESENKLQPKYKHFHLTIRLGIMTTIISFFTKLSLPEG